MAYNKRNKLLRIIDIQDIYLDCTRSHGSSAKWVYENKIKPVYHISRSTFFEYLATNARKELRELDEQDNSQLSLFKEV